MITRRNRSARLAICSAAALVAGGIVAGRAHAQSTIGYNGGTYSQNFDTLPNAGAFSFMGQGVGPFDLNGPTIMAAGMPGWSLAKIGGSGPDAIFRVDDGTSLSGGVTSYGSAGQPDRALGSIASGTTVSTFGAIFVNQGPITLNSFSLNFFTEQWRAGGTNPPVPNTLAFGYALGGPNIVTGPFTAVTSLDAVTVVPGAGSGALDGNSAVNRMQRMATVSGLNWLPGQSLVIRWADNNDAGNDDGLGIDDFFFSAAGGAHNLTWNPAGAGGTNWTTNPAAVNWLDMGVASPFANGDIVNFTNLGVGQVNVDAAGVQPGAMNVFNTTGTYSISGGPIGGNGALTKTGEGALALNSPNTYTGGTVINGGTVIVANNEALGAPQGGLTLGGGTLAAAGNLTSNRSVTLAQDTTSTIATNAASVTFAGASGAGSFVKAGTGTVAFTGAYNVGGTTAILGGALVLGQNAGSVTFNGNATGVSDWNGDLVVANPIRVNFNSGDYSGGGTLRVNASSTILSTNGALIGQTPNIGNNVALNNNNVAGPFVTTIGATAQNQVTLGGVVSGNSDVIFSSSTSGAGTGIILLNNQNTWTGATTISTATAGVVRLGVNNALPTTTALVFGTGTFNAGALDMRGRTQSVHSLRSDTTGTVNGIANTTDEMAQLIVTGNATTTFAGTIGVPADVTNLPGASPNITLVLGPTHTGELTLSGTNNHTGGTVIQGGFLGVASDASLGAPDARLDLGGGALRIKAGGFTSNRSVNVSLPGGSVDTGGFDSALLGPISGAGVFAKTGAGRLTVTNVRSSGLDVAQGEVQVQASPVNNAPGGVTDVQTLTIAGGPTAPTARLDLQNNGMIIGDTPQDAGGVEDVKGFINSGYDGGAWTGNGITSGQADRGANQFGLGYGEAGPLGITTFGGLDVQPTDVIIRFTRYGDADLNGTVNLADFNRLASNFGLASGGIWTQGDFNYDGIINLSDFNRLAANFGLSASGPEVTPQDWANLAAVVPEPASVAWITAAGLILATRRRRGAM